MCCAKTHLVFVNIFFHTRTSRGKKRQAASVPKKEMNLVTRLKAARDAHDPMKRFGIWMSTINLTTVQLLPNMWTNDVLVLAERVMWNICTSKVPEWVRADTWASYHRVRCALDPARPTRVRDAAIAAQIATRQQAFPTDMDVFGTDGDPFATVIPGRGYLQICRHEQCTGMPCLIGVRTAATVLPLPPLFAFDMQCPRSLRGQ